MLTGEAETKTGDCPKCGGSGLVPVVEPNAWGPLIWYACSCRMGAQHPIVKRLNKS